MRASVLPVIALLASCAPRTRVTPPAPAATLPSIIERVRPSIVRIIANSEFHVQGIATTLSGSESGTGFIVDSNGHIATAAHVVSPQAILGHLTQLYASRNQRIVTGSVRISRTEIYLPAPSGKINTNTFYDVNDIITASVIAEDDSVDVAVLVGARNPLTLSSGVVIGGKPLRPPAQVPRLQTTPPHDGDMILVSGFPLNIPVLVTNTGWIATAFFIDERQRSLYLGDIQVNHGNSGGPAYSASDGGIIGCVTEYRPAPEGNSRLTVIVPVQRILDLLSTVKPNQKALPDEAPPKSPVPQSSSH
jgi:hypothetical protein